MQFSFGDGSTATCRLTTRPRVFCAGASDQRDAADALAPSHRLTFPPPDDGLSGLNCPLKGAVGATSNNEGLRLASLRPSLLQCECFTDMTDCQKLPTEGRGITLPAKHQLLNVPPTPSCAPATSLPYLRVHLVDHVNFLSVFWPITRHARPYDAHAKHTSTRIVIAFVSTTEDRCTSVCSLWCCLRVGK